MSSCVLCWFFFFFSSRRRHTRYWRDWSSDVCSSDRGGDRRIWEGGRWGAPGLGDRAPGSAPGCRLRRDARPARGGARGEIGRAAGRGRGEVRGGPGAGKEKNEKDRGRVARRGQRRAE